MKLGKHGARSVTVAWVAAILHGGVGVITHFLRGFGGASDVPMMDQSANLLEIGLALAVRRHNSVAAWCLVALAGVSLAFPITGPIRSTVGAQTGPIRSTVGVQLVFLALVVPGAFYLTRHRRPSTDEMWVPPAYEVAFLRAAWFVFLLIWSLAVNPIPLRLSMGPFANRDLIFEAFVLAGLAAAIRRRYVWAGYALLLFFLSDALMQIFKSIASVAVSDLARVALGVWLIVGLGFGILYGCAAVELHRLHGPMTTRGRVALVVVAGLFALGFVW